MYFYRNITFFIIWSGKNERDQNNYGYRGINTRITYSYLSQGKVSAIISRNPREFTEIASNNFFFELTFSDDAQNEKISSKIVINYFYSNCFTSLARSIGPLILTKLTKFLSRG